MGQRRDRLGRIRAPGLDLQRRALSRGEGHQVEDALPVGPEIAAGDPYFAVVRRRQLHQRAGGAQVQPQGARERDAAACELILGHLHLVAAREESTFALHKLKKFTGWYTHGLPNGRHLRSQLAALHDVPTLLAAVEAFFGAHEAAA